MSLYTEDYYLTFDISGFEVSGISGNGMYILLAIITSDVRL